MVHIQNVVAQEKKKSKYYLGITKQQLADNCDNKGDNKKKERKNVELFQNSFFFFLHHKNITVVFEKTINRGFLRADKNTEHVPTFLKVKE